MAKVVPIITNLSGGEMTPRLGARVDFNKYPNGCEEVENFILIPQGGALKRSGTIFGGEVENSDARARLIPFQFSTTDTYSLEFGEDAGGAGYMRPWRKGEDGTYGVILSGASPVKITSPYLAADLEHIQFTQTADVLYLFHKKHTPQKLVRLSHTDWSMAATVWGPSLAAPTGLAITAKGTTGSVVYGYQITAKNDEGSESLPCTAVSNANGAATLNATDYNEVAWTDYPADAVEICVYRKQNGISCFIGSAAPESKAFKDQGQDYDATLTPPQDYQPFLSNACFPRCGAFYQDRLWLAGTDNRPQTIWSSRSADHQNLCSSRPRRDDDAAIMTLNAEDVNTINWMIRGKKVFLLGTSGAEWIMKSSDGGALTPTSVDADKETFNGCNHMRALAIGSVVLFVERFGKRVLEFAYTLESDGYNSPDLIVLAEHLTRDNVLEEWAYAQTPHRLVVTVRDDGVAPCLTYFRDHQVVGWWRLVTDGAIESVCTIPGTDRDEIWLIVRRTINGHTKRYVEILAPTFSNDETCEDAFFVDCGATLDCWNPEDTEETAKRLRMTLASSAGTWAKDDQVFIFSSNAGSGAAFNIGFASNVGKRFAFRTSNASLARATVLAVSNAGKVLASLDTDMPVVLQDAATERFAKMVTSLSGVTWLAGKSVDLLGDGKILPSTVVTYDGRVALNRPCAKVHVGLHYEGVIVPHALEAGFRDGTAVGREARISRVGLRLYQTYGLKVGPKDGTPNPLNFSAGTQYMGAALVPFTGDKDIALDAGTEKSPQIRIVHDYPLPCTVLSIVPRIHGTGG